MTHNNDAGCGMNPVRTRTLFICITRDSEGRCCIPNDCFNGHRHTRYPLSKHSTPLDNALLMHFNGSHFMLTCAIPMMMSPTLMAVRTRRHVILAHEWLQCSQDGGRPRSTQAFGSTPPALSSAQLQAGLSTTFCSNSWTEQRVCLLTLAGVW